jgi:phosphohistidine phosphatase
MKTLLILRHAKSSWAEPGLADIDRPLNKRGKRDAPRIGRLLRTEDLLPDLILSSPARRARKTAEAVAEESGYSGEIETQPDFYPGDPEAYLQVLRGLSDELERVMVVAHNPGLEELVDALTGESVALPTAALAHITLPVERWSQLDEDVEGKLIRLWRVKELT